jgi:hypothetical protein
MTSRELTFSLVSKNLPRLDEFITSSTPAPDSAALALSRPTSGWRTQAQGTRAWPSRSYAKQAPDREDLHAPASSRFNVAVSGPGAPGSNSISAMPRRRTRSARRRTIYATAKCVSRPTPGAFSSLRGSVPPRRDEARDYGGMRSRPGTTTRPSTSESNARGLGYDIPKAPWLALAADLRHVSQDFGSQGRLCIVRDPHSSDLLAHVDGQDQNKDGTVTERYFGFVQSLELIPMFKSADAFQSRPLVRFVLLIVKGMGRSNSLRQRLFEERAKRVRVALLEEHDRHRVQLRSRVIGRPKGDVKHTWPRRVRRREGRLSPDGVRQRRSLGSKHPRARHPGGTRHLPH